MLGLALISLASCSSGDSSTGQVTPGGSAALQTPLAFVKIEGNTKLAVVTHSGSVGNGVLSNMSFSGTNTVGDMATSKKDWIFANIPNQDGVALIDPVSSAQPIFEATLAGAGLSGPGDNPAHNYRDPTDPEVVWSMNDGDANGDDAINCPLPLTGGSVTILHNSHIGPGGTLPEIHEEVCFDAGGRGHHSAVFTRGNGLPLSTYITSEHDGAVIVIDNNPNNIGTYLSVIDRLDMCDGAKETTCDADVGTANAAGTHGIYFSTKTGKVYVHNEGYQQLAIVDPAGGNAVTRLDIGEYEGLRLSKNGRFLVMRRTDTTSPLHVIGKIRVLDLDSAPIGITDFDVQDVNPQTIRMSSDGGKLFLTQSNSPSGLTTDQQNALKQNILQVFDASGLPASLPAPIDVPLPISSGRSVELYEKAGALVSILVSNKDNNSLSVINAATNVPSTIPVGANPGAIFVFEKGAVAANP
jgi:YVTN family beta-propeller protein